jgi:hypothetical protein
MGSKRGGRNKAPPPSELSTVIAPPGWMAFAWNIVTKGAEEYPPLRYAVWVVIAAAAYGLASFFVHGHDMVGSIVTMAALMIALLLVGAIATGRLNRDVGIAARILLWVVVFLLAGGMIFQFGLWAWRETHTPPGAASVGGQFRRQFQELACTLPL